MTYRVDYKRANCIRESQLNQMHRAFISCFWISILFIQKSQESCASSNYPVGLKGNQLEVKYLSIDTDSSGNILLGGASNNNDFFSPDTIATTGSLGFPIFQFYNISTCAFTWSAYLPLNLEQTNNVAVRYRTDFQSAGFGFISTAKTLILGQILLNGDLNTLWNAQFSGASKVYLLDLMYDQGNDLMIVAFSDIPKYRILCIRKFGDPSPQLIGQINMVDGQPFQLVLYDTNFIWAVGRAKDVSGNEQAFHHLKFGRSDGVIDSVLYKQGDSLSTSQHILLHSDKNFNEYTSGPVAIILMDHQKKQYIQL